MVIYTLFLYETIKPFFKKKNKKPFFYEEMKRIIKIKEN